MLLDVFTNELEQLMKQGNDCLKQNKQQQALLYFNKVVLLASKNIDALMACANILIQLNRPAEAAIYSQHAMQIHPNFNILTIHAKALYQMGKYVEALNCFERILAEQPNNYITMGQRALCLTQMNRYDEALVGYEQALACSNYQDAWLHYNYSLCLLATGKLLQGFEFFEFRWLCSLQEKRRAWVTPESATIETLQGNSILICFEQGLGDSIQFFRYIPLLAQLGAKVFLETQPSLIPLFGSWYNTVNFIAAGAALPSCDYQCSMMSLPRLFKTEMQTIPRSIPYLFPDPHFIDICQKKLGYSNYKRIGISWKGSATNAMNQKRSIALNVLLTLHQPNLDFICLQKDVHLEEKNQLDQYKINYHSLELSTMIGTAALISCLDLVITVDTSIAHLAAAMGKEVWILLPFSADWRWFLKRNDSPWYPNAKLFRQEILGDWSIPLSRVKNTLITLGIKKK
jgi:tetratricopeptide (TPR) repeat protein